MDEFAECREVIERVKDILSNEIDGFIFDYMVADELKIPYSTLRFKIVKNKIPLREVAKFCYDRDLIINDLILRKKGEN